MPNHFKFPDAVESASSLAAKMGELQQSGRRAAQNSGPAEPRLRDPQELLSFVQQTALAATWEVDLVSGSLAFGPGSYPVLGLSLTGLRNIADVEPLIAASDLKKVRQAAREILNSGSTVVDFQVLTEGGRCIWVECRGQAIDHPPTRVRGVALDITQRKRNEEALVASEARYRALADLNPQAIWMGAPNGRITYVNQQFQDYLGVNEETSSGECWISALYPEDRERAAETWSLSVHTGIDYDVEARLIRATDGAARWWRLRALPVRDETGVILHWLGVGTDIHDAIAAAEAWRYRQQETERQRSELETVYQTAPVGLAQFDPLEFRYLRLNDRQAQMLGFSREQLVGKTYEETATIPGLREMLHLAALGHTVKHQIVEGEVASRPGEHRVWDVSHSPVYNADGEVEAITAAWLDITHLKRAESALVQSEKLAAVGRLASSISHEINNPLEAITNLLFLISEHQDLPEDLKVYVHMAQSELSRVSQIATQTLRFHRQSAKPTWVEPGKLLEAVLNLYQGRLANSAIRVEAQYSAGRRVLCFENDIRQVLNNLIANAIDAMRTAGGRLLVRTHPCTQHRTGRRGVRLTVADTGHGMSSEVQRRLFEPFYTTKGLNGTGLGLWISESIVQRHQGRLSVRSRQKPGCSGTVFTLFLPEGESAAGESTRDLS